MRAEYCPNSNGKKLLDLVRLRDFVVGNKLQCCVGRWTWESREEKSVIDYMLFGKGFPPIPFPRKPFGSRAQVIATDTKDELQPLQPSVLLVLIEITLKPFIRGNYT